MLVFAECHGSSRWWPGAILNIPLSQRTTGKLDYWNTGTMAEALRSIFHYSSFPVLASPFRHLSLDTRHFFLLLPGTIKRAHRIGDIAAQTGDCAAVGGGEGAVVLFLHRIAHRGAARLRLAILATDYGPYRIQCRCIARR